MFYQDPRYFMAEVYKQYRRAGKSADEFTKEVNSCEGPDDAIRICLDYLGKLEEVVN
jgi:hypothetical protein